jgi:hypothetical protein
LCSSTAAVKKRNVVYENHNFKEGGLKSISCIKGAAVCIIFNENVPVLKEETL